MSLLLGKGYIRRSMRARPLGQDVTRKILVLLLRVCQAHILAVRGVVGVAVVVR